MNKWSQPHHGMKAYRPTTTSIFRIGLHHASPHPLPTMKSTARIILPIFLLAFAAHPAQTAVPACPSGQFRKNNACIDCPAGTFRNAYAHPRTQTCTPCAPGTFQPHTGAVAKDLCQPCAPRTYASNPGSSLCTPCAEGTSSGHSATLCITCPPGSRARFRGNGCIPCAPGSYSTLVTNQSCRKCPAHQWSDASASSFSACRPCRPYEPCSTCPKNWFRPAWNRECVRCQDGTYTRNEFAISEEDCLKCPMKTFRQGAFMLECRSCPSGVVSIGPGAASCRIPGRPCARSHFENARGDCERCQAGFRFDPEGKRCVRCPKGEISRGGYSTVCAKCAGDLVVDLKQPSHCVCGKGRYMSGINCRKCSVGTYQDLPAHRERVCKPCVKGHAMLEGSSGCRRCAEGSEYNGDTGACEICEGGTMTINRQVHHIKTCVSTRTGCPLGTYRHMISAGRLFAGCRRIACTSDTPAYQVGRTCQLCKTGEVVAPDPLFTNRNGIHGGMTCVSCALDETSAGGTSTVCRNCPTNMLRDGLTGKCSCAANKGTGMAAGNCIKCPAGTAPRSISQLADGDDCLPCPPGKYSFLRGAVRCVRCPRLTFSTGGAVNCTPCPMDGVPDKNFAATLCSVLGPSTG